MEKTVAYIIYPEEPSIRKAYALPLAADF
jgi:hypothetical protein